jgi:hypothetical protein
LWPPFIASTLCAAFSWLGRPPLDAGDPVAADAAVLLPKWRLEAGPMAKTSGRPSAGPSRNKGSSESKHSHVEFGTTGSHWDREAGTDFAITTVNVPDRLDAQEVRARASVDSGAPSVRRFRRVDIARAAGWAIALIVVGALTWGVARLASPLRAAISPRGVEAQIGQALDMPVSVRATELRFLPSPRLVVTDVIAPGGLRLPEIAVNFNWRDAVHGLQTSSWVLGEARVAPVDLTGEQAATLLQSVRRASRLSAAVSTIRFESVTFPDLVLLPGRYEVVIRRGIGQPDFDAVGVKRLDGAGQMEVEIKPPASTDGSATFKLFASQWLAGVGPAVLWNEATAQGEFRATQLKVDSFSVGARFGNLNGAALLVQDARGWRLTGNVRGADVSVEELIRYLSLPAGTEAPAAPTPFRGTAKVEFALTGAGGTVADALQRATAFGPVSVAGATLAGMNLGLAATQGGASGTGGMTRLTDLDLEANCSADGLAVRNLAGRAGSLRVRGGFTVDRQLQLRGAIRAEVASPRGTPGTDVRLGGTVAAPTFQ